MNRWIPSAVAVALALTAVAGLVAWHVAGRPRPPSPRVPGGAGHDEAKRVAALGVIDGRVTLLEAGAAFRDADAADPGRARRAADSLGGGSADVGYCRSVIEWVRTEAPPARAAELAGRLEAELEARRRDGTLRLPPPNAVRAPGGARDPSSGGLPAARDE
jgi:hypothetical protein